MASTKGYKAATVVTFIRPDGTEIAWPIWRNYHGYGYRLDCGCNIWRRNYYGINNRVMCGNHQRTVQTVHAAWA